MKTGLVRMSQLGEQGKQHPTNLKHRVPQLGTLAVSLLACARCGVSAAVDIPISWMLVRLLSTLLHSMHGNVSVA